MKLAISIVTAISLGLNCRAPADNYDTLAAKGYRWVAIHGPYASTTKEGVERITNHRTGSTESQIIAGVLSNTGEDRSDNQRGRGDRHVGGADGRVYYFPMDIQPVP
jgi:hypothetical protein